MAITNSPRLGIERWSHGTDRHPPRAVWDAQQAILDDLVAIDRQYATLADRPAAGVRGTYCWVEENGVLYRDDGAQWRPIVQFGGGAGAAVVAGGSGAEGSSSRAARADHSHPLPLVTSSAHGAMRKEDKAKLDAATTASTANTLVRRNADGRSDFAAVRVLGAVTDANHATRKDYVDAQVGAVHNPTALPAAANLDAYTSSGVFIQRNTAGATNGTNYPVAQAGLLLVHSDGSAWTFQEYRTPRIGSPVTADVVFFRSRYNGEWSAWRQVAPVDYVDAGDAATASAAESALAPVRTTVNNATSAATASRLVLRDSAGRARFANPSNTADAATKGYVDAGDAAAQSAAEATAAAALAPVKSDVDAATANATANVLVRRDSAGRFKSATPSATTDVANKSYVDGQASSAQSSAEATAAAALAPVKTTVDGATANATASALVRRDSAGRFKAAAPYSSTDVANKAYVDAVDSKYTSTKSTVDGATDAATAGRLVLRDSAGRFKAAAPSADTDVANKAYVDDYVLNNRVPETEVIDLKPRVASANFTFMGGGYLEVIRSGNTVMIAGRGLKSAGISSTRTTALVLTTDSGLRPRRDAWGVSDGGRSVSVTFQGKLEIHGDLASGEVVGYFSITYVL